MDGHKIITVPNLSAAFAGIWGVFCAYPYTSVFAKTPSVFSQMAELGSEGFWGVVMITAAAVSAILTFKGYRQGAAVILAIAFTLFSTLYALADLESPAWALWGCIALANYAMFWVGIWRR